nr:unnamed protein product [Callosobruchus chinensis]
MIDKDLLDLMVEESNKYACTKNPEKHLALSVPELEKFIGICFLMSIYGLPNARMYWQKETEVNRVSECLSRNRWEQIKSNLHFNDNATHNNSTEKLFKLRPFLDSVVKKFNEIPMTEKMCVDEQMIPFKGRHSLKQYLKSKPKKWGFKAFVMCDSKGIVYNWEMYTGAIQPDPGLPDVGASGNIVLKLAKIIPQNMFYKIYYDNWFNSIYLQVALEKRGIQSIGTIRPKRLQGCNFISDKEMSRKGRGTFAEQRTTVDGVNLICVKWFDNKAVHTLSTFAGAHPVENVKRWDSKTKSRIDVPYPSVILLYNQFMGGVDLMDALIALYRTLIRSRKWYLKIYFHLMDLCVVNAWLLYRRDCESCGMKKNKIMNLLTFKCNLAFTLCSSTQIDSRKRGRPSQSSVEQGLESKKKKGKVAMMPPQDIRKDQIGHWPNYAEKRGRCKYPGCSGLIQTMCIKCKVHLCFTPSKNCFVAFHTN